MTIHWVKETIKKKRKLIKQIRQGVTIGHQDKN